MCSFITVLSFTRVVSRIFNGLPKGSLRVEIGSLFCHFPCPTFAVFYYLVMNVDLGMCPMTTFPSSLYNNDRLQKSLLPYPLLLSKSVTPLDCSLFRDFLGPAKNGSFDVYSNVFIYYLIFFLLYQ